MQPQSNQGLCTVQARQQNSMIGGGDVLHTNPYATLQQAYTTFMLALAHKKQVLTKGAQKCAVGHNCLDVPGFVLHLRGYSTYYTGVMCEDQLLLIRNIY